MPRRARPLRQRCTMGEYHDGRSIMKPERAKILDVACGAANPDNIPDDYILDAVFRAGDSETDSTGPAEYAVGAVTGGHVSWGSNQTVGGHPNLYCVNKAVTLSLEAATQTHPEVATTLSVDGGAPDLTDTEMTYAA